MRAIDGDILEKKLKDAINMCMSIDTSGLSELKAVLEDVEEMPTIEPEIVRCKDCRYMTEHYDTDGNVPYWTCSEWDSGTDYDGFCHYAERRTDGRSDK